MDKSQLNKEIVLCRSTVKRAKVCIIRKLIRQIKILRSCKNEIYREKKFRKARRLAAEIHVMKSLKPDYVTKFALVLENYTSTGSNTKLKRRRNACAKLAKHKDILSWVNDIRDKFSDWQKELVPMIEKKNTKREEDEADTANNDDASNIEISNDDVEQRLSCEESAEESAETSEGEPSNNECDERESQKKPFKGNLIKSGNKINNLKAHKSKKKPKIGEDGEKMTKKNLTKPKSIHMEKMVETEEEREESCDEGNKLTKIEDPFFIGKKITVPTLLQLGNENEGQDKGEKRKYTDDDGGDTVNNRKINQNACKKEQPSDKYSRITMPMSNDDLHPSWKAKKIQMIKPFEGKKIKFDI